MILVYYSREEIQQNFALRLEGGGGQFSPLRMIFVAIMLHTRNFSQTKEIFFVLGPIQILELIIFV